MFTKIKENKIIYLILLCLIILGVSIYVFTNNKKLSDTKQKFTIKIEAKEKRIYEFKLKGNLTGKYDFIYDDKSKKEKSLLVYYLKNDRGNLIKKGMLHSGEKNVLGTLKPSKNDYINLEIYSLSDNKIKKDGKIYLEKYHEKEYAYLNHGKANEKMLELANKTSSIDEFGIKKEVPDITSIKLANKLPQEYKNSNYLVSKKKNWKEDYEEPIYLWYDNKTVYFYSEKTIKLEKYLSRLFNDLGELTDINDLKYFDTSDVESMSWLFGDSPKIANIEALSYWDTSNVKDISNMFSGVNSLMDINPLAAFDTRNVENASRLFSDQKIKNYDALKFFDTRSLKQASSMFENSSISNLEPLKDWNTKNLQKMNGMFNASYIKDLSPLQNWNTESLETLEWAFQETFIESLNGMDNWNTKNLKTMKYAFYNCLKLADVSALSNWNTKDLVNLDKAFSYTNIKSLDAFSKWNTPKLESLTSTFEDCRKLNNIKGLEKWNTKNVKSISSLFSLTSIKDASALSNWDTGEVEDMSNAFSFTELADVKSLKAWNTKNVKNFNSMFLHSKITNLEGLENWDTSNGDDFKYMFSNNNIKNRNSINHWNLKPEVNKEDMFEKYRVIID